MHEEHLVPTAASSQIPAARIVLPSLLNSPEPARIRNQAGLLRLYFLLRLKTRNKRRYAWCGNEYLAGQLGVSVDTVSRWTQRLVALGAIAVEHIIGIERRVRVLCSPETLKARLFPGHKSNWREHREAPQKPVPAPSFCPVVAEGSAETVAEGQYRELRSNSLQTPPSEEGQQTAPEVQACSKESNEAQVAAASFLAESTGISLPEAQSIVADSQVKQATKGLSKASIQHVVSCYQAAKARGSVRSAGAWLRTALRSPEGYSAPVAPATHPSEVREGERPRPVMVRAEVLDRPVKTSQVERPFSDPSASSAGLERLRAIVKGKGGK